MNKFYITTAIPYVNTTPHIGTAMDVLTADVLARYMRQHKAETVFAAGADEHGGKIAEKAKAANLTPQAFTDQTTKQFTDTWKLLNISYDRFIRTTDPEHVKRAQIAWTNLAKHIYKGQYSGWYCTGHEEFFPEKVVKANNGVCPDHNRPYEQVQEENYFFKLSEFTIPIRKAIEADELRVIPETRKNEILSLLRTGLEDISISRPKNKVDWGIPVPSDDSQNIYVWFDALLNYITILGYPDKPDFKKFWPANVQVVGKDILRFHAAVWPAMLMGLGLQLPKTIYVHGFINLEDTKMSKTLGNMIAPTEIVEKYGTDAYRYYFLRHIPSYTDGDFSWQRFEAAYNSELADQLGNAVSRTAAMIVKYLQGVIGELPASEHDIAGYEHAVENCRFDKALEVVWEQIKGLNQYIDETKPWELAKTGDQDHIREVLAYMAGALLEIAELLTPFLPDTAAKIQSVFASGTVQALPSPLFPKAEKPVKI